MRPPPTRTRSAHRALPALLLLAALVVPACEGDVEGLQVHVRARLAPPAQVDAAALEGLVLDRVVVVLSEVSLLRCPDDWEARAGAGLLRRLGRLLVAEAWAHGVSSPTRLAVPAVLAFERVQGGEARALELDMGLLRPPPGRWCGLRAAVAAADSDAVGLEAQPDALGASLIVEGRREVGGTMRPFSVRSTLRFEAEHRHAPVELPDPEGRRRLRLRLELRVPAVARRIAPQGADPEPGPVLQDLLEQVGIAWELEQPEGEAP